MVFRRPTQTQHLSLGTLDAQANLGPYNGIDQRRHDQEFTRTQFANSGSLAATIID